MRLLPRSSGSTSSPRRQRRRLRSPRRARTLVFAACVGMALLGTLLLLLCGGGVMAAGSEAATEEDGAAGVKTFVPTREWQVIPEGAAIPPGLHVRLDLSTGQRMGKLMDPKEAAAESAVAGTRGVNASAREHIVILDDGEGGPAPKRQKRLRAEEEEEPVRTEGEVSGADTRSPQETMEAVLLKLPAPERASMGIDDLYAAKDALLASGEYWPRVEALWAERQALLQRAYDEMLKPAEMLRDLIGTLSNASTIPLDAGLRQALVDLEDHLTDIDMARDFYTLGGLRPLVALLDAAHESETRWRAAWALGNAVKNDASSQVWLLEHDQQANTTALARLVGVLREDAEEWGHHEEELLRKAVYALTSAARSNARVQAALREAGGLDAMAGLLLSSAAAVNGGVTQERRRLSLRVKLAAFGHDLAVEAKDMLAAALEVEEARQAGMAEVGEALLASVTTPDWCLGTLGLLPEVCAAGGASATEAEKVLHALGALHEHCPASHLPPKHLAASLRAAHAAISSQHFSAALDEEYHGELLSLVQELAERAEAKAAGVGQGEL